jgi:hypothetical protein
MKGAAKNGKSTILATGEEAAKEKVCILLFSHSHSGSAKIGAQMNYMLLSKQHIIQTCIFSLSRSRHRYSSYAHKDSQNMVVHLGYRS